MELTLHPNELRLCGVPSAVIFFVLSFEETIVLRDGPPIDYFTVNMKRAVLFDRVIEAKVDPCCLVPTLIEHTCVCFGVSADCWGKAAGKKGRHSSTARPIAHRVEKETEGRESYICCKARKKAQRNRPTERMLLFAALGTNVGHMNERWNTAKL